MKVEYRGVLTGYFETGNEGLIWALRRDETDGYDGLIILNGGDFLEICTPLGEVVFQDVIIPDRDVGKVNQSESNRCQQVSNGLWVHWIQSGIQTDKWVEYFLSETYRGLVIRDTDSIV